MPGAFGGVDGGYGGGDGDGGGAGGDGGENMQRDWWYEVACPEHRELELPHSCRVLPSKKQ